MKPVFFLIFSLLLFQHLTHSQSLVNIESRRMHTDSIRFVLRGDISTSYFNNNGEYLLQMRTGVASQLKTKDLNKIFLLIADYSLARSRDKDFQNTWFLHLRYNHEITHLFRIEGFVQSQHNKILDVNQRDLLGAGIRFKLISKKNTNLYWGNTYMYEHERNDIADKSTYNSRYSTYLSISLYPPGNGVDIINTIYYQPLFSDFSDYRILEQLKIDIELSQRLNMFTLFDYFYDSITPRERKQYSSTVSIGFGLRV